LVISRKNFNSSGAHNARAQAATFALDKNGLPWRAVHLGNGINTYPRRGHRNGRLNFRTTPHWWSYSKVGSNQQLVLMQGPAEADILLVGIYTVRCRRKGVNPKLNSFKLIPYRLITSSVGDSNAPTGALDQELCSGPNRNRSSAPG
jgi:hypothetical protein